MIWQRHYFKELSQVFTFILILSYILYALIDYSSHTTLFPQGKGTLSQILLYYFYQFSTHAEILIPLALLLATLKVLLAAHTHREIFALLAAGISVKKISRPFLLFALAIMALCYLNFEYMQPKVYLQLIQLEKQPLDKKVHGLRLDDLSLLIYQRYDPLHHQFFDLFWKKNSEEFYKIESLRVTSTFPEGDHVDYLVRDPKDRKIAKKAHYTMCAFHDLHLPENLSSLLCPPKWQSLRQLAKKIPFKKMGKLNDMQATITTHFCYKLFMPLSALIVVVAPLCTVFSFNRNFFPFLIYALALFGYITLFTLLGASVILGESQMIHPLLAIGGPMGSLICYLGYKYAKL